MDNLTVPIKLNDSCIALKLKWISPGDFVMENNMRVDTSIYKKPTGKFQVSISDGFWIGIYPITQCQWKSVMGTNPSKFSGNDRPVEMISWQDANAFCQNLNKLDLPIAKGYEFRLPTEAEWEYSCKAGTDYKYQIGNEVDDLDAVAWYSANVDEIRTQPVGQKQANNWGLYDMLGNVLEWCLDGPTDYPDDTFETNWIGKISGLVKNVKGGRVWDYSLDNLTCNSKIYTGPDPNEFIGFRIVLSI